MTTPLGTLDVLESRGAPGPRRPRDARDRHHDRARPRRHGHGRRRDRRRLLRPPARLARPPRPVRPRDPGDRRPPRRRAPHRRGRRARARVGVRRGARRPRRDPPVRRQLRADGRVAGDGGHRRRRAAVRGHRPARSAASASATLPLQLVEHALEAFARTAGATLHLRGTGRNDHHLAEAAFKALGRALRVACEPDPRRDGRRVDQGLARVASAARGRGRRLRRGQPRLDRAGAARAAGARVRRAHDRRRHRRRRPARRARRRRRRARDGAAARGAGFVEPIRAWIAADRPFLGICLGLQLLFEGSDEDGAETLGVLPGRTVRLDGAPTLPHIGWNQVERRAARTRRSTGIADAADFYFVHSYVGAPAGGRSRGVVLATTEHGSPFVSAVAPGPAARRPVPPGAVRRRRPAARRQRRRARGRRGPPDAPPPRDPVPRRRGRPRRQGHPLRRPRGRGRPARARRALRPRGRRRARLPRHHRRPGGPRRPCSTSSSAPRAGRSSR